MLTRICVWLSETVDGYQFMVILVISGYESNTAASQGPLISLDSNSIAFYKLVSADTKATKEECPSADD